MVRIRVGKRLVEMHGVYFHVGAISYPLDVEWVLQMKASQDWDAMAIYDDSSHPSRPKDPEIMCCNETW
jgi:hypothetical protein